MNAAGPDGRVVWPPLVGLAAVTALVALVVWREEREHRRLAGLDHDEIARRAPGREAQALQL